MEVTNCDMCRIANEAAAAGELHSLGRRWTLNAYRGKSARPWLVLQLRQHREGLEDLDSLEAAGVGLLLRFISEQVRLQTGAERLYVALLNEGSPPHVHFHLLPRFAGDSEDIRGWGLHAAPSPAKEVDSRQLARAIQERWRELRPDEPSSLVKLVVSVLHGLQQLSVYSLLERFVPTWAGGAKAEIYVPTWLAILAVLLASAPANQSEVGATTLVVGSVAAYRFLDILTFELMILLSRAQGALHSYTRSFVLLGLNVVEVALAVAVFWRMDLPISTWQAFVSGFDVATLRGALPHDAGLAMQVAYVAGSAGALILLAGALSMVVSLIAAGFEEAV